MSHVPRALCSQCGVQDAVYGQFCWECQKRQTTFVLQPSPVLPVPLPRSGRQYLPTLGDLIDRLSIAQLKAWKIGGEDYESEIRALVHDIGVAIYGVHDMDFEEAAEKWAAVIRATVVCALINAEIWHNEGAVRAGTETMPDDEVLRRLRLTHGLNGIRAQAKNRINRAVDHRQDGKTDCLAADFRQWAVQWDDQEG